MGSVCKAELGKEDRNVFNPVELNFKRVQPINLLPYYEQFLDRISKVVEFPDARQNTGLKWFHSLRYDIYLYGDLADRKPIGDCLFFIKSLAVHNDMPAIIATSVEGKNVYSQKTLLIFPDNSYYCGSIISNELEPPRADGRGLLVTKSFIYDGEFKNGFPHGYGKFKTKGGILVGKFEDGEPNGECVERTNKGLFIGELLSRFRKNGKLITPENQIELVNEEYSHSGHTIVEL